MRAYLKQQFEKFMDRAEKQAKDRKIMTLVEQVADLEPVVSRESWILVAIISACSLALTLILANALTEPFGPIGILLLLLGLTLRISAVGLFLDSYERDQYLRVTDGRLDDSIRFSPDSREHWRSEVRNSPAIEKICNFELLRSSGLLPVFGLFGIALFSYPTFLSYYLGTMIGGFVLIPIRNGVISKSDEYASTAIESVEESYKEHQELEAASGFAVIEADFETES